MVTWSNVISNRGPGQGVRTAPVSLPPLPYEISEGHREPTAPVWLRTAVFPGSVLAVSLC